MKQKLRSFESLDLTPWLAEVLVLPLHGAPNKVFARELSLSVKPVKDGVAAVLRTTRINSHTRPVMAERQLDRQRPG